VLIGLTSKPPARPASSPRRRGRAQPTEPWQAALAPVVTVARVHATGLHTVRLPYPAAQG